MRVKMYKLIACDLDETLLSDDTHVCTRNRQAIEAAQKEGIKLVPATGRGFRSVAKTLKEIGLYGQNNQYVISFNGACVTENKNNRVLYFNGLDYQTANTLYENGIKQNVCIHVYTQGTVYVYNMNEDERKYMTGRHEFVEIDQPDLTFIKYQPIAKVLYQNNDQTYLHKIASKIGVIANKLDISYSSNRYLEFNQKGVNKGAGLIWLAHKLGFKINETMALGDNFNDLTMIKAAGLGVGMQNTNPAMKDQCDVITKATNNEGGVAEAIKRFVLTDND